MGLGGKRGVDGDEVGLGHQAVLVDQFGADVGHTVSGDVGIVNEDLEPVWDGALRQGEADAAVAQDSKHAAAHAVHGPGGLVGPLTGAHAAVQD